MTRARFAVFSALLSGSCLAGEITLVNGDKIGGELHSISAENVRWNSSNFGELTINKHQVVHIESSAIVKVRGKDVPCWLQDFRNERLVFACDDGGTRTVPLLTVRQVVPFEGYEQTTHFYGGKLMIVGSQSSGNKQSRDWVANIDVDLRYTDYRHSYKIHYSNSYLESNVPGTTSQALEKYEAVYGFDWFFRPKWFWFSNVSALKEDAREISERYDIGSGFGYQFWESKLSALSLESGGQYTTVNYDFVRPERVSNALTHDEYASWRLANNFRYQLPLEVAVYNKSEYLQSLDSSDDWEVRTDTGLSMPIGFGVTANLALEYLYDNTPTDSVNGSNEDTRLRFGVGYTW